MEITQAAGEGTDAGAEGTAGEGQATTGAAEDGIGRLTQAFETFSNDVTSRFERMEQSREPAVEEDDDEDDFTFSADDFEDEDFAEDGTLKPEAQQRALQSMMKEIAQRAAQEAVSPLQMRAAEERRMAEADALEERYPELQDPKVQDAVIEKAVEFAAHMAQVTGRSELAESWKEPKLIEQVYLAEVARRKASGERPAGSESEVTLATGASAQPAVQSQMGDDGDRIVGLARKSRFRLGTS